MRFTTVLSLLFAGWALLSGSPAVFAAPIPIDVKRGCDVSACRAAELGSGSGASTTTTPQSSTNLLVKMLMDALQKYQTAQTPSNTTTTVDLVNPEDDGTKPLIDVLLGDSDPV